MTYKLWLVAAFVAVPLVIAQPPAKKGGPPMLATQQVKPGLFMITGAGANTEVRVTNEGLIVVDGKLPGDDNYNALMDQVKMISSQPIKYLIVTHHHADHSGNNNKFLAAGVQVVAQENLNKNLASYQQTPKPADAGITYDKEHTLRLGGVEVKLYHFGRAHTSGDTVVYFPDLKVVAVSDVVTTGTTGPLADYAGGGSFADWPHVLDGILKLDFDTAIAGNGNPLTKAYVQEYKTKIDTFVMRAKEAIKQGVPKDQLMAQIKTDDLGWKPRVPNVDPFYEEMK
ncbi:MAG TPA: MBL fold metallo-hydrolase [Bryobacteraceae bacterium]|nr:MBL fold metallo-hydrolase [Bryobacteraceae bacterium]